MKKVLTVLAIIPHLLFAQETVLWKDISPTSARVVETRHGMDVTRKALDKEVLNEITQKIARKGRGAITIPSPSGENMLFDIQATSVLAPELQQKYPKIKTFKGTDHKGQRVRLEVTSLGFTAKVFALEGNIIVSPESMGMESDNYVSFYESNYQNNLSETHLSGCMSDDIPAKYSSSNREAAASFVKMTRGTHLRKYRMAITSREDFTNLFGDTVEDGLSGLAIYLNAGNEHFERDLAVTLELVANNDQLILTSGNQGPFPSGETVAGTIIDRNQEFVDSVIGNANYDIGHIFVTEGSGGLAAYRALCSEGGKAKGLSLVRNIQNGSFDAFLPVFLHEIGHQIGASHTFSRVSTKGRNADLAYELGGGNSSLMSSGSFGCSDGSQYCTTYSYYHTASLIEMEKNISGRQNCAELIDINNTPPTVSVRESGFTIPINTPFVLEADGNDADGDVLTYSWEQYDLAVKVENAPGTFGIYSVEEYVNSDDYFTREELEARGDLTEAQIVSFLAFQESILVEAFEGDGPLFRNFFPVFENKRYFPRMEYILAGAIGIRDTDDEVLPFKTRDINFAVGVRDGNAGYTNALVSFSSSDQAGPFVVTSQFTESSYNGFSNVTLEWDVANTDLAPVNCQAVDIFYSTDGGESFEILLLEGTVNDGSETVKLPNIATSEARIMVKASDNVFFNVNDRDFVVTPSDVDTPEAPVALVGEMNNTTVELSWTHNGDLEDGFIIERQSGTDGSFVEIARVTVNTTEYKDLSAKTSEVNDYRVAAFNATGNSVYSNVVTTNAIPQVVSLDHQKVLDLNVYPNPAGKTLYVTSQKVAKIYLMDFSGRKVTLEKEGSHFELDMSHLQNGIYLLLVQHNDIIISHSVIKNN